MANEVKKGALFVKAVVARIKGDDAEVKATKIARKAISAVEAQIAGLNAKLVDAEGELDTAKEALADAMYPSEMITDGKAYCDRIVRAQENVQAKETTLESIQHSIEVFKELLESF